MLKFLRTRLGRLIRDINRKIDGNAALWERFRSLLILVGQVRSQDHRQRGPKVYSLHAPEVECTLGSSPRANGKARALRVWLQGLDRNPSHSAQGRPVRAACQGAAWQPVDGHTLGPGIADIESTTGIEVKRGHVDKGYRGHNHPHKFRIWISGHVRRTTAAIKREMKRRAAVGPVIGHVKAEHRMDRSYLTGRQGDRINAILAAAGYNFSLPQRWLANSRTL